MAWAPALMRDALESADQAPIDATLKSVPSGFHGSFAKLGEVGLSLEALPQPVALLRESALRRNSTWMRAFLRHSHAYIAPHGKTTMAPRLFEMQMQDGAWGLTAATAQQVALYAQFGIKRVILANQLVGRSNIAVILDLLEADPLFDFYCLVDSIDGATMLADAARARALSLPLQVLVEVGAEGGRTGARGVTQATALAEHVRALSPWLSLRGVEAYEGVFGGLPQAEKEQRVRAMLADMLTVAEACEMRDLFAPGEVILTAGGSEFFDLAGLGLHGATPSSRRRIVIRSGCYLTHDDLAYERAYRRLLQRTPELGGLAPEMEPALEVWAAVQSRPEPALAFATMGKRDISFDFEPPMPVKWFRPGTVAPIMIPPGYSVTKLNDQHAFLKIPADSPLRVGDLVGFGVSHACTTFDKWKCLLLVDDDYCVTGTIRTYF